MKKLLICLVAITIVIVSACNQKGNFVYNASVNAEGDGDLLLTFPNGHLDVAGVADVDFIYSNDIDTTLAVSFEELVQSNNVYAVEQLVEIESLFDAEFRAFTSKGHAKVAIHGYIKLLDPEIVARFDKEWEWPSDSTMMRIVE